MIVSFLHLQSSSSSSLVCHHHLSLFWFVLFSLSCCHHSHFLFLVLFSLACYFPYVLYFSVGILYFDVQLAGCKEIIEKYPNSWIVNCKFPKPFHNFLGLPFCHSYLLSFMCQPLQSQYLVCFIYTFYMFTLSYRRF
uniref:Uncharacterized protein n=1 Tax=Cacopsylla melanoneura TaxID=428564 RepID=A0A8D8LDI6_9HEMI